MTVRPIRVLVIDDSRAVRHVVALALSKIDGLELTGEAEDGIAGLAAIERLRPDVVTLDIEMPRLDGLEVVSRLRHQSNDVPIIMLSSLTAHGAQATVDALARGACDYIHKPMKCTSVADTLERLRRSLGPKIFRLHAAHQRRRKIQRGSATVVGRPRLARPIAARPSTPLPPRALLIGSSTGGPGALELVLNGVGPTFPLPIFVVQHMPPMFTALLAERLSANTPFRVSEAAHGQIVRPGEAVIAPGGQHMILASTTPGLGVGVLQTPPVNFTRPAVDVLLHSAVPLLGGHAMVAILTGMGSDGLDGAKALHARGATIFAQDEQSSVVWGMPGAIARAGIAEQVLPLAALPAALARTARRLLGAGPHSRRIAALAGGQR